MPNLPKIDLQQKYPCPCCRGQISQLVLTEALGCDQCQKIFVLQEEGSSIEQVAALRPHRWYWNGQRWRTVNNIAISSWTLATAILLSLAFIVGSWYILVPQHYQPTTPNPDQDQR